MGLAASQARLLTITSRKADCEFLSMSLSHQKLALARDMETISDEYQNAMNTTKLVYDYYGSGVSDMPLTYGLLMTPSVYNDYYPKFVTDAKNRIVLNSAYATAAKEAGIPMEGLSGLPSSEVRNKFINALYGNNIITETTAATVLSTTYNQRIGLGAASIGAESTAPTKIDYDSLKTLLNLNEYTSMANAGLDTIFTGANSNQNDNVVGIGCHAILGIGDNEQIGEYTDQGDPNYKFNNAESAQRSRINNLKLTDLLNPSSDSKVYIGVASKRAEEQPLSEIADLQYKLVNGGFLDWLYNSFASVLGGSENSNMALQSARDAVYDIICPTGNRLIEYSNSFYTSDILPVDGGDNHNSERLDKFEDKASEISGVMSAVGWRVHSYEGEPYFHPYSKYYASQSNYKLGFAYTQETNYTFANDTENMEWYDWAFVALTGGAGLANYAQDSINSVDRHDRSQCSISLSNLAQAFLTAYVAEMEVLDETSSSVAPEYSYNATGGVSKLYDPDTDDFMFELAPEGSVYNYSEIDVEASYYDTMFNMICTSGWVENDRIDDKEYMAQMFKNGMMFISSINNDGFYIQTAYSNERTILEVPDTDAIARAEAKYNTEKAKIENKEDMIDMKMKNLDTEISSLSTEYDTVKSLINKSIERSIKRYDA